MQQGYSETWIAESSSGIIAAGASGSVEAGLELLGQAGNAVDAAAATILALNVTDHFDCSVGGEVPMLIYDAGKREVKALSGQGRAPGSQKAVDWYMMHGIPEDGDIKTAPVPSVIDSCITALIHYGTKSFAEIAAPTLSLLDSGTEDWHPNLAITLRKLIDTEKTTMGSREVKLQATSDHFYGRRGAQKDIVNSLESFYISKGGFLRSQDLAAHVSLLEDPIIVDYRGYSVCKCGPWTQGPFLCQALRLLEGFDLKAMGHASADYVHVLVEAIKLAMADRDEYYGDPDFVDVPINELLSDAYTEIRRPLVDMKKASLEARPGDPRGMKPLLSSGVFRPAAGGTTTCLVADRWGNVVSATPSANVFHGTVDGGEAGVTFGNRLRSLNTTPGHPNCIEPGKRPRITLTPTIVLKNGAPILGISVAGGDLQDQVTLNLILDYVEFGMAPGGAVTAPRFATQHHQDSFDPNPRREEAYIRSGSLMADKGLYESVKLELSRRGHSVVLQQSPIGRPVMIHIDQATGIVHGAGDPAAGRHVGALSR